MAYQFAVNPIRTVPRPAAVRDTLDPAYGFALIVLPDDGGRMTRSKLAGHDSGQSRQPARNGQRNWQGRGALLCGMSSHRLG